jgi:RimJ/RimL family protein N-acetyltransferase
LFLGFDEAGEVAGYSDIQVWPEWSAAEMGGALRADRQSSGQGAKGAIASFDWIFNALGIDLICETASLDNVRTARLLDAIGFSRVGEIVSTRTDGTTRPSLVWEVTREAWLLKRER